MMARDIEPVTVLGRRLAADLVLAMTLSLGHRAAAAARARRAGR